MSTITSNEVDENLINYMSYDQCIENYLCSSEYCPIDTGFRSLDFVFEGWIPGEFYVVGGVAAMGKTSFVLGAIRKQIMNGIDTALFTSRDYLSFHFMKRLSSCLTQDSAEVFSMAEMSKKEHLPFHVSFSHHLSLDYIWSNAKELVKDHNVRCIFIEDFYDIVLAERKEEKTDDIGKICAELRLIARKLNIAIILTSNIDSVESGEAPKISDLNYSIILQRYSAAIFLLYRPEFYGIYEDEYCRDLRGIVNVMCVNKHGHHVGVETRMVKGEARYIDDADYDEAHALEL